MPEAPITRNQLRRLQTLSGHLWKLFGSKDWGDHELPLAERQRQFRLSFIGGKLGRELHSFPDPTKAEAVTAIRTAQACLPAEAIRNRRRGGSGTRRGKNPNAAAELVSAGTLQLLAEMKSKLGWNQE